MMSTSLSDIAHRHCAAARPALNLKGFVRENYGVSRQFFRAVAVGKKHPTDNLLRALNNAHHRLFPNEPVMVEIPNYPVPILLGIQPPTSSN